MLNAQFCSTAKILFLEFVECDEKCFRILSPGYSFASDDEKKSFEKEFVNLSDYVEGFRSSDPIYLNSQIGLIPFCETATALTLSNKSQNRPIGCDYFEPLITPKGEKML